MTVHLELVPCSLQGLSSARGVIRADFARLMFGGPLVRRGPQDVLALVYSWRLSPDLKSALEEAAKRNHESTAALLERITRSWLEESNSIEDEEVQRQLHEAASRHFGTLKGGRRDRASQAGATIRAKLARHQAGS